MLYRFTRQVYDNRGIWITDVLDDVTYYSNVSSNVTFEKFKWLSNDNVIGYGTDGHIYYADAANALGGHFTQTTEIGTNLDFINFHEVDSAIYCITNTGVWESSDYGVTWAQIKTGTYTNSLCGDGMIAYTTSTKIYIKNGTDFVEYNLPITSGNTVYGNGIFVCYTDGVIYTSTNCCNTWVRKYLFIDEAGGEWNTVNYLSDDLLITYTHGAFGICNYTQWALSYDFNIILSLSTYTDESSLDKWFDDGNNEYVYSTYGNNVYYAPYKTVKNIGIGKGLSSNDYTTAEKTKLAGIEAQANKTIVDSSMSTTSTNPLQNKVITAELAGTKTTNGNPITVNDAAPVNAVDVSVDIEPVQDLHGYDHPWVGGAGKNILPLTISRIKELNTAIEQFKLLIGNEQYRNNYLKSKLRDYKKIFGYQRKSKISSEDEKIQIDESDTIDNKKMVILCTRDGYLKSLSQQTYSNIEYQTINIKDGDLPVCQFISNQRDKTILITSLGNFVSIPTYKIEQVK